jgi:hypothetical protein
MRTIWNDGKRSSLSGSDANTAKEKTRKQKKERKKQCLLGALTALKVFGFYFCLFLQIMKLNTDTLLLTNPLSIIKFHGLLTF